MPQKYGKIAEWLAQQAWHFGRGPTLKYFNNYRIGF
jgi:hypothetical protein